MSDDGTNSKIKTFANVIISFIGAGILGLPYAFKEVINFYCATSGALILFFSDPALSISVCVGRYTRGNTSHDCCRICEVSTQV